MNFLSRCLACLGLLVYLGYPWLVECSEPLLKASIKILEDLNREVTHFHDRIEHVRPGVESDTANIKDARGTFLNFTNRIARSLFKESKHLRTKIDKVYSLNAHIADIEHGLGRIVSDLRYELAECFPLEKKICFGKDCYCFYIDTDRTLSWKEARWTCHAVMGELLEIHDEETNNAVTEIVMEAAKKLKRHAIHVWLGGKKMERLNRWTWTISQNDTVFWDRGPWEGRFVKWDSEATPTYEENCAVISSASGTWLPMLCDAKDIFTLCRRELTIG